MTIDPFDGDPKLVLTQDGATLQYKGGQPVMDLGVENQALIALFTGTGWCGNRFLPLTQQVGSDFEDTCHGALTLSKLNDIQNAAARALALPAFPAVTLTASNPQGDRVKLSATLGPGQQPLSVQRTGLNWAAQSLDPANRRIT